MGRGGGDVGLKENSRYGFTEVAIMRGLNLTIETVVICTALFIDDELLLASAHSCVLNFGIYDSMRLFIHRTAFKVDVDGIATRRGVYIYVYMDPTFPITTRTDVAPVYDVVLLKVIDTRTDIDNMNVGVPTELPSSILQVALLGINGDSRPVPTELV
ncbi:hypothetical protein BDD12DRAFT_872356 [Trichophaea hybrida]|nr:hypothetical protein BDD12DRAFT_872356 [Trichophaea hybrida]